MKPYSQDLRERAIAALEAGEDTAAEIARQFRIAKTTLDKWWARYKKTDHVDALPHGGGRPRTLAPHEEFLRAEIARQPDVTLAELQARVKDEKAVGVSSSMMSRTVQRLNLPRKKKTRHAPQQDTERVQKLRREFEGKIEDELSPVLENLKFLDECGTHLGMTRLFGRAAPGERVCEAVGDYAAPHYTLIAVLGLDGVTAPLSFEGALTTALFEEYVEKVLAPTLSPGEILFADNLAAHKSARARQFIEARGARLEFLPPYSPDLNPIEPCWAKMKGLLRTAKARTYDALVSAIGEALRAVTPSDIDGWFDNCGYV